MAEGGLFLVPPQKHFAVCGGLSDGVFGNAAYQRFLKANKEALLFCAQNQATCNKWVLEAPQARAFDENILQAAASLDPQWSAKSLKDIRVSISPEEMKRFEEVGKRAFELKILQKDPPIQARTDLKIADKVDAATWDFDPKTVKIIAK